MPEHVRMHARRDPLRARPGLDAQLDRPRAEPASAAGYEYGGILRAIIAIPPAIRGVRA